MVSLNNYQNIAGWYEFNPYLCANACVYMCAYTTFLSTVAWAKTLFQLKCCALNRLTFKLLLPCALFLSLSLSPSLSFNVSRLSIYLCWHKLFMNERMVIYMMFKNIDQLRSNFMCQVPNRSHRRVNFKAENWSRLPLLSWIIDMYDTICTPRLLLGKFN
jgi:hypothetical protein